MRKAKTIILDEERDSKVTFNQHIGHWENFLPEQACQDFLNFFERHKELGVVERRDSYDKGASQLNKNDESVSWHHTEETKWTVQFGGFREFMMEQLVMHYCDYYFPELKGLLQIYEGKVQRTEPGEGYHIWHCENIGYETRNRVLAWSMFLNTIDEGGETEFLEQGLRFKPKAGDVLIWPAYFTHPHRGNPPLSNDKYLATGWVELK